eukprot:gene4804-6732_t
MYLSKALTRSCLKVARNTEFRYLSTKFSQSHEYIKIAGSIGTVGITSHAADALGDVVFVDLPSIGSKYSSGDSFGSVESVKAASDVYVPVSGEVIEINTELETNPGIVNQSPSEKGWFIKLKLDPTTIDEELGSLLDESAYKKLLEDTKH